MSMHNEFMRQTELGSFHFHAKRMFYVRVARWHKCWFGCFGIISVSNIWFSIRIHLVDLFRSERAHNHHLQVAGDANLMNIETYGFGGGGGGDKIYQRFSARRLFRWMKRLCSERKMIKSCSLSAAGCRRRWTIWFHFISLCVWAITSLCTIATSDKTQAKCASYAINKRKT